MKTGAKILLCYEAIILVALSYIVTDFFRHDTRISGKVVGKTDTLNKGRLATYLDVQYSFEGSKYTGQANYPFRSDEKRPLIEDQVEIKLNSKKPDSFFLPRYNLYLSGIIALTLLGAFGFVIAYVIKNMPISENRSEGE